VIAKMNPSIEKEIERECDNDYKMQISGNNFETSG
jgi:hypothetical protein